MNLSRREGVDIRPTLLRVLADLYVQTSTHSEEEARQFVELTSRLIDQVDDATRAAVRARLALYPATPAPVLKQLGIQPASPDQPVPLAREIQRADSGLASQPPRDEAQLRAVLTLSMQPKDAAEISGLFFGASSTERAMILHNLSETPLKPSARIPAKRAARAIEALEMAAWVSDLESFTLELGETLILPWKIATQVVNEPTGEPLACAAKALGMPGPVFQRVLLFLKPDIGSSVHTVYRLSRLYDVLKEQSALIMLAAWRGSTIATTRAKYRSGLYDDERSRARSGPAQTRPVTQPAPGVAPLRTGSSQNSGR
ncbi:MAG TPA: DUF2336 domain-containing protein [Bradyrhizobium sp.]|uniref:DUF2336 domain-containing protein n=1 Tax=Bradyrhizobium sp. TaxID=376 RepID=UPI002D7EAD59|nr:DUF2336 domain-containing protein [Bradyrhizobium sp.]HET7887548.1 DUF2336 domain-containing protein [Bradyrhizobium sp.]